MGYSVAATFDLLLLHQCQTYPQILIVTHVAVYALYILQSYHQSAVINLLLQFLLQIVGIRYIEERTSNLPWRVPPSIVFIKRPRG
jgi:hypothetical protein